MRCSHYYSYEAPVSSHHSGLISHTQPPNKTESRLCGADTPYEKVEKIDFIAASL